MVGHLPEDIVFDIFVRLPTKPLLRFRCLSKHWNRLISDEFITSNDPSVPLHTIDNNVHSIVKLRSPFKTTLYTSWRCGKDCFVEGWEWKAKVIFIYDMLKDSYERLSFAAETMADGVAGLGVCGIISAGVAVAKVASSMIGMVSLLTVHFKVVIRVSFYTFE
ncbi:hypothetical protein L1987_42713 [Smallanthus sonchifolius]|uniref:Uncharacterized protein n=1 Tax=Smallanthus sonchifolius TaxID=185202 RepID=A0ACB9GLL8_9ASTR|nr:hypothetical protein L1987_42713 [Smallanthus sonchifolius]